MDTHFNPLTNMCDLPARSDCPNELPLPCPCPTGAQICPHPTDCSLSYMCAKNNESILYPCREGLLFHYLEEHCAPPEANFQCYSGENK